MSSSIKSQELFQETKIADVHLLRRHVHSDRPYPNWAKLLGAALWILVALFPVACRAENLRVLVLLSDSSEPYQSFASTLRKNLPATVHLTIQEQPEKIAAQSQVDLIVALGMKAALTAMTQTSSPILSAMNTKVGFEELLAHTSQQRKSQVISAVYLDQPWSRQQDFIRAILPKHRRIGMLYKPNVHLDLGYMQQQVVEHGGTAIFKPVHSNEKLFPTLEGLLENVDVLLALPDNTIYNSVYIRNILLSTYRAGIPFVGLSQSYVSAGAVGAIYSTPEQMADQVAASILSFAHSGSLPESQYPRDFTISLNPEVAGSISIELPSASIVRQRMNSVNRGAP